MNNNLEKNLSHGGNVWKAAEELGVKVHDIIDFSASINPLGPPTYAIEAIQNYLRLTEHYPEPSGKEFKLTLKKHLEIDPNNIVLGNGSMELIYLISRLFYKRRILTLAPSFSAYGKGINNPQIIRIPLDNNKNFKLPIGDLISNIQQNDLIFIANPNNPTGNVFKREDLLHILQTAAKLQAILVIDEAFMDFVTEQNESLKDLVYKYDNLIILRSITKFFALPGLRLGYAIASEEIISLMEDILPPWRVNTLALAAGKASIEDYEYIEKSHKLIKQEKEYLQTQLENLKELKVYPSTANFLLIEILNSNITANSLQQHIKNNSILIRDCSSFPGLSPYYFRIAVKSRIYNEKLIEQMRCIFK
ncbi:L-threonine 3-O-phosphate decarboxylase [Candidatus Syntrophocurvum alkaliphilum]|uniref:threonine-phosphate decarboxylase n=1 Tax=Candidatus Syntrophocurvum alkaliphilum TaxID=2293317 RepID=A0A6I6DJI7_9FIRM|nr:threonine-phosphate decarboxylase CobD [Candidatus Syntrophocurvum alkaliphilum]QGU00261.1 L-threonine 3-O-phosphate decarboxylase [Candidatus Syntrophocurvum alkaliphilum]